ncbi:hypothetical protein OPV22_029675 [Ensete ventricosum]|uniref:Agenet domain-containing protein n=1 Tax=Ensete ventricosum TaxID=4639 RepID=A0AAV8Q1X3_ENSVE|nr:hypothetical protein OPV22_029675 [Ensete ventricosum]
MRLSKGSSVEVYKWKEGSYSWSTARILSGNGHTYFLMYDRRPPEQPLVVERVPRKFLRPPPLPIGGLFSDWAPGDVVEAFEDCTWYPALVVSDMVAGRFDVQLVGSSRRLDVRTCELRLRQQWQNNTWSMTPKDCGNRRPGNHPLAVEGYVIIRDEDAERSTKRPRIISSPAESCNMAGWRRRGMELPSRHRPQTSVTPPRELDLQTVIGGVLEADGDRSPSSSVGSS